MKLMEIEKAFDSAQLDTELDELLSKVEDLEESIIAAAVPFAVFLVFQRYFIDGMTVGAVKG